MFKTGKQYTNFYKSKWYDLVCRMDETRKPKQYMKARPEGDRGLLMTLKEMEKLSLDRKEWKKFTKAHPTP